MSAGRIDTIDILRGLALFIVLWINASTEFRISIFEQFLPGWSGSGDILANILVFGLYGKGFILFAFLFGVGLAIQDQRFARSGQRELLVRRLIVLLTFGLIHLLLIWNGDILCEYAVAGLCALPLLRLPQRPLLHAACGLMFLFVASPFLPDIVPPPTREWMAEHVMRAREVYANGDFAEILAFRISEARAFLPLHASAFPRTLALLLLGAWAWRSGFFAYGRPRSSLATPAFAALWTGVILFFWWSTYMQSSAWRAAVAAHEISDLCLAFAYGTAIIVAAENPSTRWLVGWAAPIGRMAFSNYILQSIVLGFIFYGYGLGYFGRMGIWPCFATVLVIFAAQAVFSRWWLARFDFGPLEWLWRSLTYGKRQPFVRGDPTTTPTASRPPP